MFLAGFKYNFNLAVTNCFYEYNEFYDSYWCCRQCGKVFILTDDGRLIPKNDLLKNT